ncbi:MAG: hypothetical protein KDD28_03445 [Phaeodactylibacter sp.]|nr:hypothetical protein [Phaeodactylibacter sp.]
MVVYEKLKTAGYNLWLDKLDLKSSSRLRPRRSNHWNY